MCLFFFLLISNAFIRIFKYQFIAYGEGSQFSSRQRFRLSVIFFFFTGTRNRCAEIRSIAHQRAHFTRPREARTAFIKISSAFSRAINGEGKKKQKLRPSTVQRERDIIS